MATVRKIQLLPMLQVNSSVPHSLPQSFPTQPISLIARTFSLCLTTPPPSLSDSNQITGYNVYANMFCHFQCLWGGTQIQIKSILYYSSTGDGCQGSQVLGRGGLNHSLGPV